MFSNGLLSQKQFGFSPQKSTEDAINHLIKIADQIKKTSILISDYS
jgi:hypothetical protein